MTEQEDDDRSIANEDGSNCGEDGEVDVVGMDKPSDFTDTWVVAVCWSVSVLEEHLKTWVKEDWSWPGYFHVQKAFHYLLLVFIH